MRTTTMMSRRFSSSGRMRSSLASDRSTKANSPPWLSRKPVLMASGLASQETTNHIPTFHAAVETHRLLTGSYAVGGVLDVLQAAWQRLMTQGS